MQIQISQPSVWQSERRLAERRHRRFIFVLHERRSGFDRRQQSSAGPWTAVLLGVRDHPAVLVAILVGLNLLNALDVVFTFQAFKLGAVEANPIARALMNASMPLAVSVKLLIMVLATVTVWRLRSLRVGLTAAVIATLAYAALTAYHLLNLALVAPH
jgi:hypothetical protein